MRSGGTKVVQTTGRTSLREARELFQREPVS